MKRVIAVSLVALALSWPWRVASANGKSDFALFDGTNPANAPTAGAVCGSGKPGDVQEDKEFTYHITVTNWGSDGIVRITYFDGDITRYKIKADETLNLTGVAGSKGGADRAVRVSNEGGPAVLAGQMSALGNEPFCLSCDAVAGGGVGDVGCDAIVPD